MKKVCFICFGLLASPFAAATAQTYATDNRTPKQATSASLGTHAGLSANVDLNSFRGDTINFRSDTIGPTQSGSDWDQKLLKLRLDKQFEGRDHNLILEPSFSSSGSSDARFRHYSAEIKIGSVSFEKGSEQPKGWYVFAATDGEAVSIDTSDLSLRPNNVTVSLDNQITIGELQAGVSTYVGDNTQLTFSYMETEANYSNRTISNSQRESFAGISLAKKF